MKRTLQKDKTFLFIFSAWSKFSLKTKSHCEIFCRIRIVEVSSIFSHNVEKRSEKNNKGTYVAMYS